MTRRGAVEARAEALRQQARCQYWIVASIGELHGLIHGVIDDRIRQQAIALLHRGVGEGREEYAARLEEMDEGGA